MFPTAKGKESRREPGGHSIPLESVVINSLTQRRCRVIGLGRRGVKERDRVWNAYDIDGCYILNLQQKRALR